MTKYIEQGSDLQQMRVPVAMSATFTEIHRIEQVESGVMWIWPGEADFVGILADEAVARALCDFQFQPESIEELNHKLAYGEW